MKHHRDDQTRLASIREALTAAHGDWQNIVALWSINADLTWLLERAERGVPAGVLDEAALREALNRLGPGTIADLAWSPNKHEWRADLGYWAAVHDDDYPVEDDYPMASLARALAAALGRSGSDR